MFSFWFQWVFFLFMMPCLQVVTLEAAQGWQRAGCILYFFLYLCRVEDPRIQTNQTCKKQCSKRQPYKKEGQIISPKNSCKLVFSLSRALRVFNASMNFPSARGTPTGRPLRACRVGICPPSQNGEGPANHWDEFGQLRAPRIIPLNWCHNAKVRSIKSKAYSNWSW